MAVARPFAWVVLAVVAVSLARVLFTDVPPGDMGRLAFIIGYGGILLSEALFAKVNRQLDARGLVIRKGTLIDATIVDAAVKPHPGVDGTINLRRALVLAA